MKNIQYAKKLVRDYIEKFDAASSSADLIATLQTACVDDYAWRSMHPFYERNGIEAVVNAFWKPFIESFTARQRRMDFFFAGQNDCGQSGSLWVVNAGNFMGLFEKDWLGIPATGKVAMLRYAEFHRVEDGKIAETAMFFDILSIMHQARVYPLPPMTGHGFIYPGPKTHDGLIFETVEERESKKTLALINSLIEKLGEANKLDANPDNAHALEALWHSDMAWYGPFGIGASYTIPAYIRQHQAPFRENLADKKFHGHVTRFAEGNYGAFFGWPNLTNRNKGGFLGMAATDKHAPMRVVDLYRREGNKLAENWIYIDMLHYLYEQGVDILRRSSELNRTDYKSP